MRVVLLRAIPRLRRWCCIHINSVMSATENYIYLSPQTSAYSNTVIDVRSVEHGSAVTKAI